MFYAKLANTKYETTKKSKKSIVNCYLNRIIEKRVYCCGPFVERLSVVNYEYVRFLSVWVGCMKYEVVLVM